jgi:hypothetical protein
MPTVNPTGVRGVSLARIAVAVLSVAATVSNAAAAGASKRFPTLGADLEHRAVVASARRKSTVIISLSAGCELPPELRKYARLEKLDSINAEVLDLPDSQLADASRLAAVSHVHGNTMVYASNCRTGFTSGAFFVRNNLGFTGVGVAMIDSAVGPHDDLTVWKALDAPWVITVGASSTMGTLTRRDDQVAAFSARGPTQVDRAAKPDLVAWHMTLTGTSMAPPVVSATVAPMLQAPSSGARRAQRVEQTHPLTFERQGPPSRRPFLLLAPGLW